MPQPGELVWSDGTPLSYAELKEFYQRRGGIVALVSPSQKKKDEPMKRRNAFGPPRTLDNGGTAGTLNLATLKGQLRRLFDLSEDLAPLQIPDSLSETSFHDWLENTIATLEALNPPAQPGADGTGEDVLYDPSLNPASADEMPAFLSNVQRRGRQQFISRMFQLSRSGVSVKTLANSLQTADSRRNYDTKPLDRLASTPRKPARKPARPRLSTGAGLKMFGPDGYGGIRGTSAR